MVSILGINGRKCISSLCTNLHGKCGAAEAAEIFNKIPKLSKIYLRMGKTARVSETEKMYDIIYFIAVLVGKTDFNTQKPVSEKKYPKNTKKLKITLNPIKFLRKKIICILSFHRIYFY